MFASVTADTTFLADRADDNDTLRNVLKPCGAIANIRPICVVTDLVADLWAGEQTKQNKRAKGPDRIWSGPMSRT